LVTVFVTVFDDSLSVVVGFGVVVGSFTTLVTAIILLVIFAIRP